MSEHYCMYKDGMCELDIDEAYQQGKADAIEECITTLKDSYPLVDDTDILYGFGCAIHRLEQLKEQKNDNT